MFASARAFDHPSPHLRELALGHLGVAAKQPRADGQLQHGVAQELEPLVVGDVAVETRDSTSCGSSRGATAAGPRSHVPARAAAPRAAPARSRPQPWLASACARAGVPSARSIVAAPTTRSPSYSTSCWPGATALTASRNRSSTASSDDATTSAAAPACRCLTRATSRAPARGRTTLPAGRRRDEPPGGDVLAPPDDPPRWRRAADRRRSTARGWRCRVRAADRRCSDGRPRAGPGACPRG
jgi:hypothetical protein